MSIILYVGLVIIYVLVGLVVATIAWALSGPENGLGSAADEDFHIGGWITILWPIVVAVASLAAALYLVAYIPKNLGRVVGKYGDVLRARMPSVFK